MKLIYLLFAFFVFNTNTFAQLYSRYEGSPLEKADNLARNEKKIGDSVVLKNYNLELLNKEIKDIKSDTNNNGIFLLFVGNCYLNTDMFSKISFLPDSLNKHNIRYYIVYSSLNTSSDNYDKRVSATILRNDNKLTNYNIVMDYNSDLSMVFGINPSPIFYYLDKNWIVKNKGSFYTNTGEGKYSFNQSILYNSFKTGEDNSSRTDYPCRDIF